MNNIKAEKEEAEKLVKITPVTTIDFSKITRPGEKLTKKRIRRIVEPHLRPHQVKGRLYYTFCRGTDKEIYLGSAESILKAVKEVEQEK